MYTFVSNSLNDGDVAKKADDEEGVGVRNAALQLLLCCHRHHDEHDGDDHRHAEC